MAVSELYLEDLSSALFNRRARKRRVLFIGKTNGRELQVLSDCGTIPLLTTESSDRDLLMEADLLDKEVSFDGPQILWKLNEEFKFVVFSEELKNPLTVIDIAVDALGPCGFIMFPVQMSLICDELDFRGLLRLDTDRSYTAVYLKHPGLPEEWE